MKPFLIFISAFVSMASAAGPPTPKSYLESRLINLRGSSKDIVVEEDDELRAPTKVDDCYDRKLLEKMPLPASNSRIRGEA